MAPDRLRQGETPDLTAWSRAAPLSHVLAPDQGRSKGPTGDDLPLVSQGQGSMSPETISAAFLSTRELDFKREKQVEATRNRDSNCT